MKWVYLALLCPVLCQAQRQVTYNPADSTFVVPKERLVIIEQRLRHYDVLLPFVDSLSQLNKEQLVAIENLQEALKKERNRQPNVFERLGYSVASTVAKITFGIIQWRAT